jgi:PilZ domain
MIEGRAASRFRVEKPAWIERGGIKISCIVRDLSLTGASLEVFDPKSAPTKFTLLIPGDDLEIPCRVIRRTEFRIGVEFD